MPESHLGGAELRNNKGEAQQKREGDRRCFLQLAPIGAPGAQSCKETMTWYTTLDSESPVHPHSSLTEGRELQYLHTNSNELRPGSPDGSMGERLFLARKETKCLRPS